MINKLYDSFDKAVADVSDGAIILLGGFTPSAGTPSALIRAIYRKGIKNLTIVANTPGQGRPAPGAPVPPGRRSVPNIDNGGLLIQNGQVSKAICAYPGQIRPGSVFHTLMTEGKFTVELVPQGTIAERIRAARAGIPAFYTATGVGTVIEKGKETRMFNGRKYLLEHALNADFAFVRAHKADRWGNLVYQGTSRNFNATMAGAAKVTIAEVDEMVQLGDINPETVATPSIYVNRICSYKDSREGA